MANSFSSPLNKDPPFLTSSNKMNTFNNANYENQPSRPFLQPIHSTPLISNPNNPFHIKTKTNDPYFDAVAFSDENPQDSNYWSTSSNMNTKPVSSNSFNPSNFIRNNNSYEDYENLNVGHTRTRQNNNNFTSNVNARNFESNYVDPKSFQSKKSDFLTRYDYQFNNIWERFWLIYYYIIFLNILGSTLNEMFKSKTLLVFKSFHEKANQEIQPLFLLKKVVILIRIQYLFISFLLISLIINIHFC